MFATRDYSISRITRRCILIMQKWPIWPGHYRYKLLRMTGMVIDKCYVGCNVSFDGIRPDLIKIEEGATITTGTVILTHFFDSKAKTFEYGPVTIRRGVFIGMNTLIVKPVIIGCNSVIGAGSVVTKSIGDNEIWAGNPAKFIRKYEKSGNN